MKKEWFDKVVETSKEIQVTITKEDVYEELYEICEREHSSCNSECLVYKLAIEEGEFSDTESNDCPYFKHGKSMFERLRGKKLVRIAINGTEWIVDEKKVSELIKELKEE